MTLPTPAPAAPIDPAARPTMCLLHADFHVMDTICWGTTMDWYVTHPHLQGDDGRDAYLAEVERKMLDHLVREYRCRRP